MNLLYLTFSYLPSTGGVQRSVYNLAAEFTRRGHHVTIATDGTTSGVRWVSHPEFPADVFSLRIPAPYTGMLNRLCALVRDSFNLAVLATICRRRRVQLVHCHLINVDTRYALALKRMLGIRVMITLRGGELTHWIEGQPRRRRYVQRMLRSTDAAVALSQAQLAEASRLQSTLPLHRYVIPNPIDPASVVALAANAKVTLPAPRYLIFSGRLEKMKNVEVLIQAYHRVVAGTSSFPFDLVLVGAGSLESQLRQQAVAGAGANRILFLGERPYDECLALIQGSSCLVLPSIESEGCPNVLLEAMALGTPVVVSDYPPLLEMITDGVNGEIFSRYNPAALAACLDRLPLEPERWARYVREATCYLNKRHRMSDIGDAYERVYRALCES
jgi:glycosyltransferase involved in cell wall biosynthesis